MNNIRVLIVFFLTEIRFYETECLRGVIINMPKIKDVLFHNHTVNGYRYHYPLIQYKSICGKAAILFIGDGTDSIAQLFSHDINTTVNIGTRTTHLYLSNVEALTTRVQLWNDTFHYTIRKYLPLNKRNYEIYCNTEELSERLHILEQVIVGNILSFAKGIDLHIDGQIEVKITWMSRPTIYKYKGVKMKGFDLEFKSNISLPDYIGLGKGVSLGFGMIKRMKK